MVSALGRTNGTDTDGSGIVDPDESTLPLSPPSTHCARYTSDATYPLDMCGKGPAVLVAQAFLWAFQHNLVIDGYFGPSTADAVRNFQLFRGLEVDGLIGPRTWRALTSAFTCGTDTNHSGLIDPDEIELSPLNFTDFYLFLIACHRSGSSTQS